LNFSVDLNNKKGYINNMKNKEIRFWWNENLYNDYILGNEGNVEFKGKGELNEEMWKEIRKKVGLLKSFKLKDFGLELNGEGWEMLSNNDWYLLVVDEGCDVMKCVKEYGNKVWE
jgi:hypothetical protein